MYRLVSFLSLAFWLGVSLPASAQVIANELLSQCELFERTATNEGDRLQIGDKRGVFCFGFVAGIQAASAIVIDGHTLTYACLPPESTGSQLIRVFLRYARAHPQDLHLPAGAMVIDSFQEAFPCRK